MELKEADNLIESFMNKKRRWRTITVLFVFILIISVVAFLNGFFGEKGTRAVGLSSQKTDPQPIINQHTEGDQAPAVVVAPGGKTVINYGAPKDKGTRE